MTPRLRAFLIRVPLFFGITVLLECLQFQRLGVYSSYPTIHELWVIKHLVIALILGAFFKVDTQSTSGRKIAKYFAFSFLATVFIHLDYPGTRFCGTWCGDLEPLAIPFVFFRCLVETGMLLFLSDFIREQMPKAQKPLYILGVLFPLYFITRPSYLQKLNEVYPVTWLNDTSSFRGGATYMRVSHISVNEFILDFEKLASQISKDQWMKHCARYSLLSFDSPLFGKSHKDACYYYAAVSYRDPNVCSHLTLGLKKECETGVALIQKIGLSKKELRSENPSGPLLQETQLAPELGIFAYDFKHGDSDTPYLEVINPTSNKEIFPQFEILGGLTPQTILKLDSLILKPGEIHRIELSKQKKILSELGFGDDFLMLSLKSNGKELQSFHNRILLYRYKPLCLRSWNLNPSTKEPLYIELYNFSDSPQNAERTDINAYGFPYFFTKNLVVPPHKSQKIELEFLRKDLQGFLLKERPTEILSKSLRVTSFPGGTIAATGNIEKILNFCASPKR